MSNLNKFIELVLQIADFVKKVLLIKKKEDLKNAAQESIDSKDQRPLENEIGTTTDTPTQYDGMYKRPRKK